MRYIEPHGHMVSRVTDDYVDMVTAGLPGRLRTGLLGRFRPQLGRRLLRLLRSIDRARTEARRQIRPASLLLALHQPERV